jgi:hypothetical protein
VSDIGLGSPADRAKDILGRVYEYFLAQFASVKGAVEEKMKCGSIGPKIERKFGQLPSGSSKMLPENSAWLTARLGGAVIVPL